MIEVKETGGARIGMVSASWPFATLTVNRDKLQLNVTIIGNLIFKPGDIISIEPYSTFIGRGLKINHRVPGYKTKVVFWTFGGTGDLIKRIGQTGFLSNTSPIAKTEADQIAKAQAQGGFPIKTTAAIAIVVIWNIFFLMDFQNIFGENKDKSTLGIGAQLALGFILLTCILLLTSEPVRRLILKEGRTIGEIKKFILFLMFICGFMLLTAMLTN